jgi:hypothetical protein
MLSLIIGISMLSVNTVVKISSELKPEIQTSSGIPVVGGYQALDPASINISCRIEPKLAFLQLRSSYDLSGIERLLEATAIHPTIRSTFRNPIANHEAFSAVDAASILALREKRRAYTYIDDLQIAHHPHIGNHVVTVATVAVAIGKYLRLDKSTMEEIARFALLHDGNKLADMLNQRAGELQIDLGRYGIAPGHEVLGLIAGSGLELSKAAQICEAGGYTGHSSLLRFLEIAPNGKVRLKPGMLVEKIVHLSDDMTSETTVLTTGERMVASKFAEKYEYLWKTGIGIIQTGNGAELVECSVPPKNGVQLVGMYADLQPLASSAICAELLSIKGGEYR